VASAIRFSVPPDMPGHAKRQLVALHTEYLAYLTDAGRSTVAAMAAAMLIQRMTVLVKEYGGKMVVG
jgi:hypothetical protein